jgi:ATP-binding cassette subfamily B protein/ATP-binding cassette subfamily C protein LapB
MSELTAEIYDDPAAIDLSPITETLTILFSLYDIRVDVPGIVADIALDVELGEMGIAAIFRAVCEKIGCEVKTDRLTAQHIETTELPLVAMQGEHIYLCLPKATHDGVIHHIGVGKSEQSLSELYGEACEFNVILILPPVQKEENAFAVEVNKFKEFTWFWNEFIRYKSSIIEIVVCSVFTNLFALALPLYTMNVYDRVVVSFAEATLMALTIGVVIVVFFDFMFRFVRSYIMERCSSKLGVSFDLGLMEKIFHTRAGIIGLSVGEMSNLFKELQAVKNFFAVSFMSSVVDFPFFILFILIIYLISPMVALVPVIGMIMLIIINLASYRIIGASTKQHVGLNQSKTKMLIELLGGVEAIQSTGGFGNRLLKWKRISSAGAGLSRKHNMIMAFVTSLSGSIVQLVQVMVVLVGVYQIQDSALTVGGLIACSILSGRAMASGMRMPDAVAQSKKSLEVLSIVHKLYSYNESAPFGVSPKGRLTGSITMKDVSFTYPKSSRPALSGISFTIHANEKVGIIGMSGAGKTTLANLLVGMEKPAVGEIMLDDFLLHSVPRTELKRHIGYLPQEPSFFEGTIRDNIAMGREVSEEEMEYLVDVTGLYEILKTTGEGLDGEVAPRGHNLSPGQRQAIAIARGLVGNPSVIVFDEPTTGMDNALEHSLRTRIPEAIADKTFVMITHKTTLLPLVDRLILLVGGKVLADGPRDKVLAEIQKGS